MPDEDDPSVAVEPKKDMVAGCIPQLIVDMSPPVLWQSPGYAQDKMRDVIKAFISTQQTSFTHYQLPDLGDPSSENMELGKYRGAKRRKLDHMWTVAEVEIISNRPKEA